VRDVRAPSVSLLLVLLSGLAGLVAAAPAGAAVTVTYSGTTIGLNGTGSNMTFVGFTTTYDPNGTVTIRDGSGVINASGGACATETQPVLGTTIHCPAATTTLHASYGPGNDRFIFDGVCIPTTVASLGEGSNSFEQNWTDGCPPDTVATVTGGSGNDLILGGAGADTLNGGGGPDEIRGGAGDDAIDGGDGNDELSGDHGNDSVLGRSGDDQLKGGDGNDLLDGGDGNDIVGRDDANPGADDLRGGSGHDELRFTEHAPGIAVTLDEQANDGSAGEGDNVRADFERYLLSPGDDAFVGSANRELVEAGSGNDALRGGGGDDELRGDSGDDQLLGEAGADLLVGGAGNDTVDGGAGLDTFFGDDQSCSVYVCSAGADRLLARDAEADAVNCGAGADSAVVDAIDVVAGDGFQACESVDRAAAPGGTPGPGPGKQAAAGPAPFTGAKATAGKRRFTLRMTLRKAATVSVKVTRRGAKKALGTVRYKAKAGRFTRTITKVRGKRLRRGTYKLVVTVAGTSKALTVKVR
jgi:hypothetical protein